MALPGVIAGAGEKAQYKYVEFFTATIRNKNTRLAYARAVNTFFAWCEVQGLSLEGIHPVSVAAYVESHPGSVPTVKQHLAAIRKFFDWFVVNHVVAFNPASSVRGPKYSVRRGKTPVLTAGETRELFEAIEPDTIKGLRDRAILAVMFYAFARVSAVVALNVEDYYHQERRSFFRLSEKGGKVHEVPAHHQAQAHVDVYLEAAGIALEWKAPLFRSVDQSHNLTDRRLDRESVFRMMKRRAEAAGITSRVSPHSARGTGITNFLEHGGHIEQAQAIANHADPRTTKLYDRTSDVITQAEIERVRY